jgi:microcystin-dependent protein
MGTPYLGEIKLISFNFPPKGWAFCNGQLLPINQNQALFSIMGTTYGGNGQTNFALPDLRGRMPAHWGQELVIGERAGEAAHTLNLSEMPAHVHFPNAHDVVSAPGTSPAAAVWAAGTRLAYAASPNVAMAPGAVANVGGSQPHENQPPYLVLNFIVALQGIFPSRN